MKKILLATALILVLLAGWGIWTWGFCRTYVNPGEIAIVTAKEGNPLEAGQILAKAGQKGILEDPLGPGRHFLNPYKFSIETRPMTVIPPGKVGVVTSKVGTNPPSGEFLAEAGQKGIWRYPLGPGTYVINPYALDVEIIDAKAIPIGYVGVVTSLSGTPAPEGGFASAKEKGVMEEILQPGLYYLNPKAYKVDVIEIGVNQISLSGQGTSAVVTKTAILSENAAMQGIQTRTLADQTAKRADYINKSGNMETAGSPKPGEGSTKAENAVAEFTLNQHLEFPSRDGFKILLDMTVEFELLPEKVAGIYRDYGDMPAVVEKILMPQILSASRLKGSAYKATDFILGEGREKFQADLTAELKATLGTKNIEIHDAIIRAVKVPETILEPLQLGSIAVEQDRTNLEKQNTQKKQGELNTETQLVDQRSAEVTQETAKLRAEIKAQERKEVAEIKAEMTKQIAVIARETAQTNADRDVILGKAQADATKLVGGEKAKGLELKVRALGGAKAYTRSQIAESIRDDMKIRILHAGEGTLWTDGNFSQGEAALIQQTQQSKP